MSVHDVVSFLQNAEYRPKSAVLGDHQSLMFTLSPPALMFFNVAKALLDSEPDNHLTQFDLNCRWSDHGGIIDHYWAMDSESRAEALGLVTFFVHECTHHIDHLVTPYGASFHLANIEEYRAFKQFAGPLVQSPDGLTNRPLILPPASGCSKEINSVWGDLYRVTKRIDACQRTWNTKIEEGWGDEKRLFRLMGGTVEAVTVNSFLYTVRRPGSNTYVGAVAILEARAMVHALCWILFILGYDHSAEEIRPHPKNPLKHELLLFMNTYYRREVLRPEYRLLIDLFAGLWGQNSLEDLITEMPIQYLFTVLLLIDGLCWYALHTPPSGCSVHEINKSPAGRLLLAMLYCEDNIAGANSRGEKFRRESTAAMLTELDESAYMRKYYLLPVEDCLAVTLEEVRKYARAGYGDFSDGLREHFDRLLGIQETQMSKRLSHGYNSFLGLPQTGNPAHAAHHYVSSESQARDLLHGFDEKPEVSGWFTARENLLYKYVPELEKRLLLLKYLT